MIVISYTKHMLTGNLAGMALTKQGFSVPDKETADVCVASIERQTRDYPGTEVVTGNKFWVSNIEQQEVHAD
jgi:hypothetical protein